MDCGSLVPTLIESELFGYVRGAFTGAVRAKDGLLATAEGGTIFLDEIGELPVDLQAKLLRAIQEKEIRPVGSTRAVPINVRILAATNRDLDTAVSQGTFRRDLYFRLNVLTLRIPPLRERKQDIPLLIGHVLERINEAQQAPAQCGRRRFAADAQLRLAGQCARTGELRGARLHHLLTTYHPRDRSAYPAARASRSKPRRRPPPPTPRPSRPWISWRSRQSYMPLRFWTATNSKRRAAWALAKPLCTAN